MPMFCFCPAILRLYENIDIPEMVTIVYQSWNKITATIIQLQPHKNIERVRQALFS